MLILDDTSPTELSSIDRTSDVRLISEVALFNAIEIRFPDERRASKIVSKKI